MSIRRTKRQKKLASVRHVNTQLTYEFGGTYNSQTKKNIAKNTDNTNDIASIKKDLIKSLIVALLILISLTVIYLLS